MSLLTQEALSVLHEQKVLLAFSAGADSTALFFTLLHHKISFDIAIVHYGLRTQADEELAYAHRLASDHKLQCHCLKSHQVDKNFESEARSIRYNFFESLIKEHAYTYLLTAHHLQDRLEWMLMQLSKGAGMPELLGMSEIEKRPSYTLFRPLINTSKEEILSYLRKEKLHWYHDASNDDLSYKRNYFRHKIVNELIKDNSEGIKQSFRYLQEDISDFIKEVDVHTADKLSLFISSGHRRSDIYHIDKILKTRGYLLTASQREALKHEHELVVGRKFLITLNQGIYTVCTYLNENMDKSFKEECRLLGIPIKLRPYLFKYPLAFILYVRFLPCEI